MRANKKGEVDNESEKKCKDMKGKGKERGCGRGVGVIGVK